MKVSTAMAKDHFTELLRAAEAGEQVVITRHGKPVARIGPVPKEKRGVRLGGMKGRVRLLPGWDKPISEDELLGGKR
ncbi:MAG TPA: type II toxin-antitoxin system prevent-host-death family antitoxin [Terracidiphilus sp.]|nr:type II toxin-antitoxin system prevent-host-death family antitoxin [Terracidiphilus sp.]